VLEGKNPGKAKDHRYIIAKEKQRDEIISVAVESSDSSGRPSINAVIYFPIHTIIQTHVMNRDGP
jgi:hypothetical protein